MGEIKTDLAASQNCGKKRLYKRNIDFDTLNAGDTKLFVSMSHSFNGHKWHIHDDNVCIQISDIGEVDEETGEWEGNPDIINMPDGMAWLTMTAQQARQLARKLLRMADKCRTAGEVDRDDPELLQSCSICEAQIRRGWKEAEREEAQARKLLHADDSPLLPPELERTWQ